MPEIGEKETVIRKKMHNGDLDPFFAGVTYGATTVTAREKANILVQGMIRASLRLGPEYRLSRSNFSLETRPYKPVLFRKDSV